MNINLFRVDNDNKIKLNKYKLIIRHYNDISMKTYTDMEYYCDDDEAIEWKTQQVAKHKLLELISEELLDTSEFNWIVGIELRTGNIAKEILEIASYGSYEAYQASLPSVQDEFLLDLDCRMSLVEMGVN